MYLRFVFEDGVKIGLKGWQAMARAERLALSHFPVDTDDERAAFVQVLRGFAESQRVPERFDAALAHLRL